MKHYHFQNTLISKKQLKSILSWAFTNYGSVQASFLADELKYLGFKYSTKAGISISIEDLKIPAIKNSMLEKSNEEVSKTENNCLKGTITEVERFQKVIDTWNITSETLKDEVVSYFRNYDPLNSVYMMAFSGARGNLSQVRQLVGMRGLMSDPNGEIMDLPIKQNFREGLTITDYLMSGYGARKGIVDTALKTANSGYLTRRLIDVAQDIIIREKDCLNYKSVVFVNIEKDTKIIRSMYDRILGRTLNSSIYNPKRLTEVIVEKGVQITPNIIKRLKQHKIEKILLRSPLTCGLNRSICQKCYGWNLANENLVDLGEAVGIVAGQSIGEPGTQLTMRTFHTGGIFTAGSNQQIISSVDGVLEFSEFLKTNPFRTPQGENVIQTVNSGSLNITLENKKVLKIEIPSKTLLFVINKSSIKKDTIIGQIVESSKQTKSEKKEVLSKFSGEVYITKESNPFNDNKLAWIFGGELIQVPKNSYLNFDKDLLLFKNSFIWRTKIINKRPGIVKIKKDDINLSKYNIEILSNSITLDKLNIKNLKNYSSNIKHLLQIDNFKFFLKNFKINDVNSIPLKSKEIFGNLISNDYDTVTGGIPYIIDNFTEREDSFDNSFLWLSEENHLINRDINILNVEDAEYVSENHELVPNIYSKIPGVIQIIQKNSIIQEIIIRPGKLYRRKDYQDFNQKIFYPGETLFDNIDINQISFSQIIDTRLGPEILIRPISFYQVPKTTNISKICNNNISQFQNIFLFKTKFIFHIRDGESIKANKNLKLIETILEFDFTKHKIKEKKGLSLLVKSNSKNNLDFIISEDICLNNFIPNELKKSDITLSLIVKNNQFINSYTTLGYVQRNADEFLKFLKIKTHFDINSKLQRLLCIREKDCLQISKTLLGNKKIDQIINQNNDSKIRGRVIDENDKIFFVQQGQPYFFPSNAEIFCKNGDLIEKQQNIGQLRFEKEITGDIVQGLPRVEEILEGRKVKWKPIWVKHDVLQKHSTRIKPPHLICDKTLKYIEQATLDGHINLHTLLKLYFHWYLDRLSVYEATYRSIKKIQRIILNLIQSVYQSQGVAISDKHLEVIVKQMTTKVKVTHEGDTPLLPNELIDLHQIKYINESITRENKKTAFYEPILLGITKASLNTDSFISAASFQETTRVLTKAAIEGKVDWLRGLKENVIIGRLIPAGTGFNSYATITDNTLKISPTELNPTFVD